MNSLKEKKGILKEPKKPRKQEQGGLDFWAPVAFSSLRLRCSALLVPGLLVQTGCMGFASLQRSVTHCSRFLTSLPSLCTARCRLGEEAE